MLDLGLCYPVVLIDVAVHQWMKTTISPMATGGPFPVVSAGCDYAPRALRSP